MSIKLLASVLIQSSLLTIFENLASSSNPLTPVVRAEGSVPPMALSASIEFNDHDVPVSRNITTGF